MGKRKVCCVVGTRPEAIKMAPVIQRLKKSPDRFETRVLATAQHREMLDQALSLFEIVPDIDLDLMEENQALSQITSRALDQISDHLRTESPDLVLAQGDTTTVLATALSCFYQRIKFGHVEAGLRTGNRFAPFPEELNRKVAGYLGDHHFAPTDTAAQNLLREGVPESIVHVTGNTVIDALFHVLQTTEPPPLPVPEEAPYILITCHRREHFGAAQEEIFETIRDFAVQHPDLYFWYPVHPNPKVVEPAQAILSGTENIILSEPMDYVSFVHAMNRSYLLLTDSGGIQEEAPSLGKPVLVLRDTTERPEAVEAGTCLLVGPHRERIESGLNRMLHHSEDYEKMSEAKNPYGDGRSAERIEKIISNA